MRIEHVSCYVADLEAAREFFVRYLGGHANNEYHNPTTDFRSYFISFDDGARLELMTKPGLKSLEKLPSRLGYDHIALSLGSKERVDELTQQLKDDGYKVLSGPRVTGDGYYESCIVAIEDLLIELTV